ncbi:hypothetical protein [Paenibacillus thermotolerans]|uniref:hypothetical protein n=1 Tax=Paenibacillus thermotolerans TaxID=3027807 RepID=UPI0023674D15|nr:MULTISPECIES: hypothetical protein [unclassified Paenibacillus]
MAGNRRLITDQDFQEAMLNETGIRVFRDDHVVDAGVVIIRFDDSVVVTQSGVSDISYHDRRECDFFEMNKR